MYLAYSLEGGIIAIRAYRPAGWPLHTMRGQEVDAACRTNYSVRGLARMVRRADSVQSGEGEGKGAGSGVRPFCRTTSFFDL